VGYVLSRRSLKKKINLAHQLTKGLVKVFFKGQAEAIDTLKKKYDSILPSNAFITLAGKSVAISVKVSKIDPLSKSFFEQKEKVEQALQYLMTLEELVSEHGNI